MYAMHDICCAGSSELPLPRSSVEDNNQCCMIVQHITATGAEALMCGRAAAAAAAAAAGSPTLSYHTAAKLQ
jgi:hypothetical protein